MYILYILTFISSQKEDMIEYGNDYGFPVSNCIFRNFSKFESNNLS